MSSRKRIKNRMDCSEDKEEEEEEEEDEAVLIGGLPDHLAQLILSRVNTPSLLYSVSKSWRSLIYSPSFPPFLSLYALLSSDTSSSSLHLFSLDPISGTWSGLPRPDPDPPFLLRHPSFIARNLPVQSVSVSDNLVLLAATTYHLLPALTRPFIFNPLTGLWRLGPPISTPRRWCVTGSLGKTVYIASGVGSSGYTQDVARSAEKWVLEDGFWEEVAPLKHGRFSREAVEAVGWRGKLCVVNVKGNVVKEGLLYDGEDDTWKEMPRGMLSGWNGHTAAMDEGVLYSVDDDRGMLMRYNSDSDSWEGIVESVELLRGAVQIVARGGRVCIVCAGGGRVVVVDVAAHSPRILGIVHPPPFPDMKFVTLHVLPRMPFPHSASVQGW